MYTQNVRYILTYMLILIPPAAGSSIEITEIYFGLTRFSYLTIVSILLRYTQYKLAFIHHIDMHII